MAQLTVAARCGAIGHRVTAARNELQRQSDNEGGVGRPEATCLEVLGTAWGPESVPAAGTGHEREGLGIFSPDAQAWPQREVEADRWATTTHRGPPGGSDPLRRKLILNIENNFPFNIEQKIIQNKYLYVSEKYEILS
jgi:hypothetical protein